MQLGDSDTPYGVEGRDEGESYGGRGVGIRGFLIILRLLWVGGIAVHAFPGKQ